MRFTNDFSLYAGPKNKAGKPVFYYRLRDESGKRLSGKSTGQTSRSTARRYLLSLIESGRIGPQSSQTFAAYAKDWWKPGKCRYLAMAQNNGTPIGLHHAAVQRSYLKTHIIPYFVQMRLSSIRVQHIEEWRLRLYQKVAPATAANIFSCLRTMMNEAERLEMITRNPMRSVKPPRVTVRRRVILGAEELKELFRPKHWKNSITFAVNIFAALTGARLGECLALRGTDVHDGYVVIQHSLGRLDGMKSTKTGVVREVPLPRIAQRILRRLTDRNGDGFLFSGDGGHKPLYNRTVTGALRDALQSMGITPEEIKQRGLTFHGWRHFYNTILLNHGVPIHIAQQLVGHRTDTSTNRYSAHQAGEVEFVRPLVDTALRAYLA